MNKSTLVLINLCVFTCTGAQTQDTKTLELTGSIVAPWVKGQICAQYKHHHKKLQQCFNIQAGQIYKIEQIPTSVTRVEITRSFYKHCPVDKREKNRCKTFRDSFFLTEPYTTLNLTYDNWRILKDYTMPPLPAMSNFGYPEERPSMRFAPNYRSNADGMAI